MQDATRATRCLATLERLTGQELLFKVWSVLLRMGQLVRRFTRGELSPAAMLEFETALQDLARELCRVIMEDSLNRLEPRDYECMPQQLLWEGEYYRKRPKSPLRNLNCLFGPISLQRFCFQRLETCGRCLFPLEIQLGIVAGVATPALADLVARLSVDLTQGQVLEQLLQQEVKWGIRTLRKLTSATAASMAPHRRTAQVQQLLTWLRTAAEQKVSRPFTLSVGRDGVMLPILKSNNYKEASTATISVIDRYGKRLGTVYLGQMPESGQGTLSEELTALLQEVLSQWTGALPRLVYVTDCGFHPTEYFEKTLSRMEDPRRPGARLAWQWIVDYYHACQYITKLAEAIFGPGRHASAWARRQRRVLKEEKGGIYRVLRSAGALLHNRGLVGSEESYELAYAFLRERTAKMDYPTYRRLRLPIGSGVTEAACKILFTQRFKQSGMKWSVDGGNVILTLRTIALSGVWSQVRDAALRSAQMPTPLTPPYRTPRIAENPYKTAA